MEIKKNILYSINFQTNEKELALFEKRVLFNLNDDEKTFFSHTKIKSTDSVFIKASLDVILSSSSYSDLLIEIEKSEIKVEDFKVEYLKLEKDNIEHSRRLAVSREIGNLIIGEFNMKNPTTYLGVTFFNEMWYFGYLDKNDFHWHEHENKPNSYSNSIDVKLARTSINLLTRGNKEFTIVDLCCGIGTTLVEGLDMGYNIVGYEINSKIAEHGNSNLEFYGFQRKIKNVDMHYQEEEFHCAIVDMPYGVFSHTTKELQKDIIKTARKVSKRFLLISFEPHFDFLKDEKFNIVDSCTITKGSFTRYITICE